MGFSMVATSQNSIEIKTDIRIVYHQAPNLSAELITPTEKGFLGLEAGVLFYQKPSLKNFSQMNPGPLIDLDREDITEVNFYIKKYIPKDELIPFLATGLEYSINRIHENFYVNGNQNQNEITTEKLIGIPLYAGFKLPLFYSFNFELIGGIRPYINRINSEPYINGDLRASGKLSYQF